MGKGGHSCSVAICKNTSINAKNRDVVVRFFAFPKDAAIRKEWIVRCHRADAFNPDNGRICSDHFNIDDYEDSMKAKLMNDYPKKLNKTAIPTLLLLPPRPKDEYRRQTKYLERKQRKETIQQIVEETEYLELLKNVEPEVEAPPQATVEEPTYIELAEKVKNLEETMSTLKEELKKYEDVKMQKDLLEKENTELKKNFESRAKELFKECLSENQIEILLHKKLRAKQWTKVELSRAFTLRYFSKRSYSYVRSTLKYPLPGLSTLRRWAQCIDLRSGILEDVLSVMDTSGATKTAFQKCTILSFDEMKVAHMYEYDKKEDEIVGPHNLCQVVMARGLFDNWKQPIYIGFDTKVTVDLLTTIIQKLDAIKFSVVGCVSDCSAGNQGLWRDMQVSTEKSFFEIPGRSGKIYFFADIPHTLKLLRNWFLDTGFELQNGERIDKQCVEALINDTATEISSCHKLTPLHVSCEKTKRQNVRLAAELFSRSTATALQRYKSGGKEPAERTSKFILTVNNWFDVMNSYTISTSIPTKKPYGCSILEQEIALREMKNLMATSLCQRKKSLQVFQKAIIFSINSLFGLFEDLKNEFDISYILTHRLNQDCLENFFSQLRTRGGLDDHPTPLNAIYRIRMMLLGKNPGIVQQNTNPLPIDVEDQDEYLVHHALKRADVTVSNIEAHLMMKAALQVAQMPAPLSQYLVKMMACSIYLGI